ncbi:MAG: site-specific DNA-methyltransferase [Nitrosopumilus sp.]|nr:site-specific DNA-methyltransferase [Nitrosopumilus sp.]NRA05868.1 site-specific DNA-methyltransferase [Nitrosopumilus sp.]
MVVNGKPKKIDYSSWSQTELIKEIKKLEKRKKYGIIWDEERTKEVFEEEIQEKLPVLKDVTKNGIEDISKPNNILIEGDNYHTLSVLSYTHKNKIDVIYIDPPYNTGNKTWKYNNNFVDKDDGFRHSKWLSFMNKRLKLAKTLLTKSGKIIVSIDDYEVHTLRLLMDEIFDEKNRLSTITVVHNPRGRNDDTHFATMHEYMLIYSINPNNSDVGYFDLTNKEINTYNMKDEISNYLLVTYMRGGNNSDRHTRPKMFYPIYYNPKTNKLDAIQTKGSVKLLPINNSGDEKVWKWGKDTFLKKKDTELIVRHIKNEYKIFKKRRLLNITSKKPRSVWYDPRYDASSHGIMLLRNILRKKDTFPYPKSLWTTYDILKLISKNNSTVLDFFAGSGTTGHAVLELNKEDGGTRRFILCTNNENNICTDVCYPRLKKVIKGYKNAKGKKIEGLGGNLKYFKTYFINFEPTDQNKKTMVEQSTEMLCLKEDCFELVKEGNQFKIFKNHSDYYLGIIYYYDGIEPFKKEILKLNKKINTYVFSLTDEIDDEEFIEVDQLVTLKPIPSAILNVYKRIFAYVQTKKLSRKARK